jgi:hypothetical protein
LANNARSGRSPRTALRTSFLPSRRAIAPVHTKCPGIASISTPNRFDRRSRPGRSSAVHGRSFTTESSARFPTLRMRATTPCRFRSRSSVSRKYTLRAEAREKSTPRDSHVVS